MKEKKTNIIIINLLKIIAALQLTALFCLIVVFVYKVIDYEYFGETSYFWQSAFSKCTHEYGCKCPKGGGKCICTYYNDEKGREEKIKCQPIRKNS